MQTAKRTIGVNSILAVLGWSLLVGCSLGWNSYQAREATYALARGEAVANINKDLAFRHWATAHGGVYVPVDPLTQPNPYLTVPERDIETPSGLKLTLMNPAYMLREMQERYSNGIWVTGHITSLKPINPTNTPDPWERQALESMQHGVEEVSAISQVDGTAHIRVIRAMHVEPGCMKCHAAQGYRVGDLRGGISSSVSLAPYLTKLNREQLALTSSHGSAWAIGLFAVLFFNRRAHRRLTERQITESGLRESEARFRSVIETARNAIVLADDGGLIRGWNHGAEKMFGFAAGQAQGQPLTIIMPPEQRAVLRRAMDGLGPSGELERPHQFRGLRKDGSAFPAELTFGTWSEGDRRYCAAVIRDLTERLHSEERQRLTATVFEFAHEGIVITDPQARILEVNNTFLEITGYARDEVVGANPSILQSGRHGLDFYQDMWRRIDDSGFWRGEIWNRRKSGEVYPELLTISAVRGPDGGISHYVGTFADISQLKAQQERLELLAHYDPLTQLPNRVLLADRLSQAIAQSQRVGSLLVVGLLDLDGFKQVNDELGHNLGDRLLVQVAERLKSCLRGGDTIARLGGDEFVLLLGGLESLPECDRALNRLLQVIAAPYTLDHHVTRLSASIGVTLYPADGADPDTLIRHADQAMYVAKESGRNRYHLFDAEHDRQAHAHREAYSRVEAALHLGEFCLYYQPKVDMRRGVVVGAEALIRWQHPQLGSLPPSEFLPLIDNSELAQPLGEWVIDNALSQMSRWREAGLDLAISVNIAARHLQSSNFTSRLALILGRYPAGLAERLEFEVLETAALENISVVAQVINECRRMGISFALDDFGTGYSSLSYLKRLPADTLKIDQSFVRSMLEDIEDLAIVEGVISLSHAFHRDVIAEGVESLPTGGILLQLGCDLAQGYAIARPMPAEALPGWVAAWLPDPSWQQLQGKALHREDLPLMAMQVEHRRWIDALLAFFQSKDRQEPPPSLDPHGCRLGRWYDRYGQRRFHGQTGFSALGQKHESIHALAQDLVVMAMTGRQEELKRSLPLLLRQRDELLGLVEALKVGEIGKKRGVRRKAKLH